MDSSRSISQSDVVQVRNLRSARLANPLAAMRRAHQRLHREDVRTRLALALVSRPAHSSRSDLHLADHPMSQLVGSASFASRSNQQATAT